MKHKKKQIRNSANSAESIRQWRKNFIFNRRSALREQKKSEIEQEKAEIFEKRRQSASDKKAPLTVKTKSFYRFSKDFPNNVDDKGFRENDIISKKRKKAIVWGTVAACILTFCFAFTLSRTGIELSMKEPSTNPPVTESTQNTATFSAYRFTFEELYEGDTEKMTATLKSTGCDTAVFEYKTEHGYVIFPSKTVIGASANKRLSSAVETVQTLSEGGIKTAAYISCFKDSVAAVADLTYSVRQTSAEGGTWRDNSDNGWLNPFSQNTTDYILTLVKEAAEAGFDYILLDNVCFSTDAGNAKAYYTDESTSKYDRNTVLQVFVTECRKKAEKSKVIVMCDISAYNSKAVSDGKYGGNMLSLPAKNLAVDLRLSRQAKTVKIGSNEFSLIKELPYVFVLEACEYAAQELTAVESSVQESFVVLENSDSLSDQISAAKFGGFTNIIIW